MQIPINEGLTVKVLHVSKQEHLTQCIKVQCAEKKFNFFSMSIIFIILNDFTSNFFLSFKFEKCWTCVVNTFKSMHK